MSIRFARPVLLAALLLSAPCFSQTGFAAEAAAAPAHIVAAIDPATLSGPVRQAYDFVDGLGNRAVKILADKGMNGEQKNGEFRKMLNDSFDLTTIGRFVIGRTWYSATPEQQAEYMRLFEKLVVSIYSDRFNLYKGEQFKAVNARAEGERDIIVNSNIASPGNPRPIDVEWRVRNNRGKMAIIDVIVEGVSMSVTQRQEYMAVIQRNGGAIDPLLDMMRQRLETPKAASNS